MNFPAYKKVSVADLIPYARNARTHSEEQVAQIAASIREFGFLNPVIIDGANGIVAGHGRVLAAQKLGLAIIPAIEANALSPAQKRAYVLADNKLALKSGWDFELLKIEIDDLQAEGFDLSLTGFDAFELDSMFGEPVAGDAKAEWEGMPAFENEDHCYKKVVVNFANEDGFRKFFETLGQPFTEKTKSIWFPHKERRDLEGVRYVDDGDEADNEG